jgi:pimeloyl-ACP methyl ester carboxylesterase
MSSEVASEWAFLRRLASFCRVISFNRQGSGASDPVSREGLPDWEDWADDALAVLDAVASSGRQAARRSP